VLALSLASVSALVSGCSPKEEEQDKNEPAGTFPVRLLSATFPSKQNLTKRSDMTIVVQNAGTKRVPEINVTVKCPGPGLGGSFETIVSESDVADPQRPQFIVDRIPTRKTRQLPPLDPAPLERSSQLVDTYPLGPLDPGRKATFIWKVTAVRAGPFRLCWRVNAGLYGKARAVTASGGPPISGQFRGSVSNKAPRATVTPSGQVIDQGR
jgi:hypothetical protein